MKKSMSLIQHPIMQHKLSLLRKKDTPRNEFRLLMRELSALLAYEATRDLPLINVPIETPLAQTTGYCVDEKLTVVSILRGGNGMLEGTLDMLPFAKVGFIGIYKDQFIDHTIEYCFKVPDDIHEHTVLLLDPVLATGDTISAAIERIKSYGVNDIRLVSIISNQRGIDRIHHYHADVSICAVSIEDGINEDGFLLPGIGNASARLYE